MNSAPLVTVLGMHRSGTSALAGLLTRLGLHAGAARELLPAAADNPRGFFERADVVDLNDRLLRTRAMQVLGERLRAEGCDTAALLDGFGWLLGAFASGDGATDDTQHADDIGACLEALAAGAGSAPGLVLKDPRLSLTFPAWHRQAAHSVVLIGLRTPAAVIDSLARRDHIPTALGAFLWTRLDRSQRRAAASAGRLRPPARGPGRGHRHAGHVPGREWRRRGYRSPWRGTRLSQPGTASFARRGRRAIQCAPPSAAGRSPGDRTVLAHRRDPG